MTGTTSPSSSLSVCTVALLFAVVGSPAYMKKASQDRELVSELQNAQYQIVEYWQRKGELPKSINDLNDPLSGYKVPITNAIEYSSTGETTFKLCGTFKTAQKNLGEHESSYDPSGYWEHTEGVVCFDRTIDKEKYPLYPRQAGQI